jgi:hypothetical protein
MMSEMETAIESLSSTFNKVEKKTVNSKIGYLKLCIQRGEKNENK